MKYNKNNKLRLFEICAGYGSQALALRRLREIYPDFDYELVGWAEFDPFDLINPKDPDSHRPIDEQPAVIAHNALHPEAKGKNYGDITKITWENLPDFDFLTYSTPCQSISQAGLQHGFAEGSGTRSSIIWNVRDAVKAKRPKYMMLENVKAMVNSKNVGLFNLWQSELRKLGYTNFAQVLNSKSFNVPQNRERIFLISIRIDDTNEIPKFNFPKPRPLQLCLADILEEDVDETYFLSDEMLARFCEKSLEEESETIPESQEDGEPDFEDFFVAQ